MGFLYSIFDNPFARKALEQVVLPNYISDNIKYGIRPYQEEAFKRYIYLDKEDFEEKPNKPYHLLYNMATGSGKTLVIAQRAADSASQGKKILILTYNITLWHYIRDAI